jgi:hypothetical protein
MVRRWLAMTITGKNELWEVQMPGEVKNRKKNYMMTLYSGDAV